MKCMLVISCLVALAAATPGYLGAGTLAYGASPLAYGASPLAYGVSPLAYGASHLAYAASPLAYSTVVAPAAVTSQHHSQDTLGQYSYGYQGDTSAKEEVRTADGVTRGGYSYLDGHGLVQSASYVSDPYNGFRVAATNLPQGPVAPAYAAPAVAAYAAPAVAAYAAAGVPLDTPEVAAAKAAHFQAHVDAKAQLIGRKKRSPGYLHAGFAAPVAAYAAPAVAAYAAPVAVAPVATFGYSSVSAHPATVAVAHAAPVAVTHAVAAYAAPFGDLNAHHIAKAHLFGRKKRSPGYLNAGIAAPALGYSSVYSHAYASPLAYSHGPVAVAHGFY